MKYKLRMLTIAFFLAASANACLADGQSLVAEAARQLLQQRALEAKIRQRVNLFGQQLVGAGIYRQLFEGPEKRLRLELKLQTAGQVASVQQVSDGRFLYVRRDWPEQKSLSRVDLRRIREAARDAQPPPFIDSATVWMALGGLPKLLHSLDANFQFGEPSPDMIGPQPVWVLGGVWKTEKLVQLLPDQRADILAGRPPRLERLPAHLPDSVVVVLGRDDLIPLFPYRISYLRRAGIDGADGDVRDVATTGHDDPAGSILTVELFDVGGGVAMDPRQFNYEAGEQEVVDQTDLFLQRLGLSTADATGGHDRRGRAG